MLFANSEKLSPIADNLRDSFSPSDLFFSEPFHSSPSRLARTVPKEFGQSPDCLPSPASSIDRVIIRVDSQIKNPKPTTLPSFRELEAFPTTYLPSPPLDMSRPLITNLDNIREPSQEKYPQYYSRDLSNLTTYPYSGRYIQGEPNHSSWQSTPAQAMPAVISPHEIHPYPTAAMQSALMGKRRKPSRGDSEYVKRPRRRAEEVDRQYTCSWPGCDKAYGALNHLNTHVRNANHGPKREPREFQEIRREQKAKLARQREQRNSAKYRLSGNEIYRTTQYSTANVSHEFSLLHSTKFDTSLPHSHEFSALTTRLQQPYPTHTMGSRTRHETNTWSDISQEWRPASPVSVPPASTRWSPDNYHDLYSRHPSFAKDLLSQSNFREATFSPRDIEIPWNDDRLDHTYIQGPNGPGNPRGYVRKEF